MMTKHALLILTVLLVAGCQSQPADSIFTPTQTQSAPLATETPFLSPSATPTESEKEAPDLTIAEDCKLIDGEMQFFDLESEYLDAGLQFRIWLPPCYQQQSERHFPVLYMIHGQTFNDDQWDRLGLDEAAQAGIAAGDYEPFIIVMPFDLSSAQPSVDPFERAFIQELIPYIDSNFRTLAESENRAVGGLSRGASWALHFAFYYPELFIAVGGHSPPVFVEDAPQMRSVLAEIPSELMPSIWMDIGEKDQQAILNSAIWFEDVLTQNNIPHEWHLFTGYHDENYWSSHVTLYLSWYTQNWQ